MAPIATEKGHELSSHKGTVNVIKYSSNGEYCLSGGMDRTIKIWNPNHPLNKDRLIQTFTGHGWEVQDIDLSADNTSFVSGGGDKAVFLWDVATCQVSRKFSGHTQKINCVHFNLDSSVIASGSYDTTVRLWDCRSQSRLPIQILEEGKDSIISLRILGHEILTGSVDNKVRLYDLRMGKLSTDDMPASVTNVAFTKDTNCLLISSLDDHVRLIDKADGTLLNHFGEHKNKDYKISATTNFDDSQVITGSEDGLVYIYDLLEGTVLARLDNNSKRVTSVAAHPSESQILTSSFDGTITAWDSP